MEFLRRNINKKQRNGEIIAYNYSSSSISFGGGGSSSSSGGNYLPAISNGDGTYTVDLSQVTFNGHIVAQGEVSAYGSGATESGGTSIDIEDNLTSERTDAALSANQGRILKELIDNASGTSAINIDINKDTLANNQILVYNVSTQKWENKNNEGISEISKLKDVSLSNLSNNQILQYDSSTSKWVNKDFSTEVSAITEHINDTIKHITAEERTNWNNIIPSAHTHSNKTVLDGITDSKVNNWDKVYADWNEIFEIDSNGDLKVKVNVIGEGEISAYGSGTTETGSTDIDLSNYYTKEEVDDLIDNIEVSGGTDIDLSEYSKTSHTHSNYATLDHTHSNYSLTSHTHPEYASSSHTHSISNITNLQSSLDAKSDTSHTHSNYATTTNFNSHSANTTLHITSTERTNWNKAYTNNHTHSNKTVIDGITSTKVSNWDNAYSKLMDYFYLDDDGYLHTTYSFVSDGEVSAYGSGSETGGTIDIDLSNYYTKAEVDDLIDNIDVSGVDVDLSEYSKTSHTHSNYAALNHSHNYASSVKLGTTSYNVSANTISLPSYPTLTSLSGVSTSTFNSHTANTTAHITAAERTKWNNAVTSSHTHSNKTVLDGITSTKVANWDAAYTNNHTHSNKTVLDGITSSKVTNWDAAYTNNHTHSNKTVLDGITSTKVANWDKVYEDWNDVFTINSDGSLQVKVNVIGEGEISAYGSGSSESSSGAITIVDNLTSTATTAALSANQGRVLKNLIDNIDVSGVDIDLSDYSKTSHTHSNYATLDHTHSNYSLTSHTHSAYASSSHTHPISAITSLQSTLDGKSGTGHSHSNYSLTSHSHSNYSVTSHTHSLSALTSTAHTHSIYYDSTISRTANTVLAAPNGKAGGATFRSLVAADIPTLAISKITNLQSSLDGKSGTGHSHSNYSLTSHSHSNYSVTSHTHALSALTSTAHTHTTIVGNYTANGGQQPPNYFGKNRVGALMMNTTVNSNSHYKDWLFMDCYNGNDVGGGVAIGVNRQELGAYIMRSASGRTSWAESAELLGTHNWSTYCAAKSHTHSTLTFSAGAFGAKSYNGGSAVTVSVPTHTSHITNNSGYITTAATVNASNKLATARTLWGQSFNGTANVSGNITGSYFKINDTSSNPYLQLTQGSIWYIQGYSGYLYLGAGSTKSLRIDATGNCLSVGEVTAHSDRRLKSEIKQLTNRGYVTPTTYIKDGKESIGFIAQDMQQLYPELVTVDESTEEKYLTVNYMQYTAVLQAQIIDLKKEIEELKEIIKNK